MHDLIFPTKKVSIDGEYAIKNSFGFHGTNASVVFCK
jgi:3-oxoacyl-(acyl-carrier-protein) synthase